MPANDELLTHIVDIQGLKQQLAQGTAAVTLYKQTVKRIDSNIEQWLSVPKDIEQIVQLRSLALDCILRHLWQSQFQEQHAIALIAVGGYGRAEMLPKSDIDLLLLFADESLINDHTAKIEHFLMFLWDIGLEVGSSVRTFADCEREAKADITITTNLLETRLIAGDNALFDDLSKRVYQDDICSSLYFFQAKTNEQKARHNKLQDTEYSLEPNIKTGLGGLRDIQTIGWVAKRHFGANHLSDLIKTGFLSQQELQTLLDSQHFLWSVRYFLHSSCKREEDRLLFDLQPQIAQLLQYTDNDKLLAVEQLMQDYYRCAYTVREINEVLLQHFSEAIVNKDQSPSVIQINARFNKINQRIDVIDEQEFNKNPSALLEVFYLMCQDSSIEGLFSKTRRLIKDSVHLIDEEFRQDKTNIQYFNKILQSHLGISSNLRRMNAMGILGRYIPAFGQVIGQMQYDLFHIYTVDAHTLLTLRNIRKFRHKTNTDHFPVATSIYHRIDKIELLYLAALFHDLGKGKGGDHSKVGARLATEFCTQHNYSQSDTKLVAWLVQHHLLMSITSQRKDTSDPEVLAEFLDTVKDLRHLNYLFLLTVADIYATNPELWNSWRAELLRYLYVESKRALRRGVHNLIDRSERIELCQRQAIDLLTADGFDEQQIIDFWDNPGDDYFLRETPANIAWHYREISRSGLNTPKVLVKELHETQYVGATQIFIYAPDRVCLFRDIATTLANLNLSIQDARVMTSSSSGFSLDTFIVLDEHGDCVGQDQQQIDNIITQLLKAIEQPEQIRPFNKRVSRAKKVFNVPAQVSLSHDLDNHRSIVEVSTADRPGLLAICSDVFANLNISMTSAKISTLGEKVEDLFFIQTEQQQAVVDNQLADQICTQLTEALNNVD